MSAEGAPREPSGAPDLVLEARGLVKTFGRVVGLNGADLELRRGEILGLIGDNGAGKSTLIKCISGAMQADAGQISLDGRPVTMRTPRDAHEMGLETVFQTLAVSPALDIASNLFLGRELRKQGLLGSLLRFLDKKAMVDRARRELDALGISTLQNPEQTVETLSGGQRQAVAVARAAAFGSRVVILDEPTAALGVRESAQVVDMIRRLRDRGISIVLVSHNMPMVFEVSDRVHIHRLGRRAAVVTPQSHTMTDAVAIMTGAATA